jgi:long-subunit fatty acid transport protein
MKHLLLASCLFYTLMLSAQNEQDAILYSSVGAGGSARTLGMAGSFSAIGADPSAALINPAGIATVRRNEFNMGLQFMNVKNHSSYLGNEVTDSKLNFNMPTMNLNFARVYYDAAGKPKKNGLANISFGFNINRLANFHNRMSFEGQNKNSSITDYFASAANNQDALPDDLYLGYLESIAYSSGAIENLMSGGLPSKKYVSRYIDSNRNNLQTGTKDQKGSIYEYQFSIGANFSHKINLGLGLLYSSLRFSDDFDLLEIDNQSRANPDLEQVIYNTSYKDKGTGFGAKIGAIFRPNDQLRLGIAMHTPKTYNINTQFRYDITSVFEPGANVLKEVRAYTDGYNTSAYKVTTPSRVIAAIGFVINKAGLVNAEVEFYDYSATKMKAADYAYVAENQNIRKMYKSVMIFRLGTELNFPDANNKEASYRLRFGYANYPSQFSSKASGIDAVLKKANNLVTTGFGYREKDYYMDFALTYGTSSNYFTPYVTGSSIFPVSSITSKRANLGFAFTVGFNFE